ncbi:MAG: Ig-like domain repeat protein [Anaerolineales bacterium]|nr:Ig-like domain repeat protein [Anaerolineales bacterium]
MPNQTKPNQTKPKTLFKNLRFYLVVIFVLAIYFLPLGKKPEFIAHNGQIIEIPHNSVILQSVYPESIYATCGEGGTGTNCHTGCCSAGACVVCTPQPPDKPPVIHATLNCTDPGTNGWCKGALRIELNASDPQGYSLIISGELNGENFACPVGAKTCAIPVTNEGIGAISYRVDSSSGLADGGTSAYKLDQSTPQMNGTISGALGQANWYISESALSVSAADSVSGMAEITVSVNGVAQAYSAPIVFSDGVYALQISATDNAGNISQTTQTLQVDTLNPSVNLAQNGTPGNGNWYTSGVTLAPTASDAGSGVASFEISIDNGAWSTVNAPSSIPNGRHSYQLRATDIAGNQTETPAQTVQVDTVAPDIDMPAELDLGETLYYSLQDDGSGLAIYRAVIEDDDERYQKLVWVDGLSGNKFADQILWDGKFKDGTQASTGAYMITLKISDVAGNERMQTTLVHVQPLSFLQTIPTFTVPASNPVADDANPSESLAPANPQTPVTFGGEANAVLFDENLTVNSFGAESTTTPSTNIPIDPNILWGAGAMTLLGATLAAWEAERKRKAAAEQKLENQRRARARYEAAEQAKKLKAAQDNRNDYMENKMNNIDAADNLQWEAGTGLGGGKPLYSPIGDNGNPPSVSGGDEQIGYEIRPDGLIVIHYYGEIKVVNLNSDIDSQTQEWLDTFYSASDDRVEAIKDRNNAQTSFFQSMIEVWLGGATSYMSIVTAPSGWTIPIVAIGVGVAIHGGVGVYQAGMQWGEATQAIATANTNSETAWNQIENHP